MNTKKELKSRLGSACNFTYDHYTDILQELKKSHKFTSFKNATSNDIILRHDIDTSLHAALKMAKIEKELGISSTFFILLSSEFYNPISVDGSKIIREILALGHKLGLHYNDIFIFENNVDATETITTEINLLEQHFNTKIEAVASHERVLAASKHNKKLSIKLPDGIVDAYSEEFFKKRKYLSDSAQFWREGCLCQHLNKYDELQVLVHTMWWSHDGLSKDEIMDSFLGGEYDNYTHSVKLAKEKHQKHANNMSQSRINKQVLK